MNATEPRHELLTTFEAPFTNRDAERDVLAGFVDVPDVRDELAVRLERDAFSWPEHQALWDLLLTRHDRGDRCSFVAVCDAVMGSPDPGRFGGVDEVARLLNGSPSNVAVLARAEDVLDAMARRRMRSAAVAMLEGLADRNESINQLAAAMGAEVDAMLGFGMEEDWVDWGEATNEAIELLQEEDDAAKNGTIVEGHIGNPLESWGEYIPTFIPGEFHIIAARPAMGKSSLARLVAMASARAGHDPSAGGYAGRCGVGLISLEMSPRQLARLEVLAESGVSSEDIRLGEADQSAWDSLEATREMLGDLPIKVCRRSDMTAADVAVAVRGLARQFQREGLELGLVVVDYLQLLKRPRDGRSTADVVGEQSRTMKLLAKSLDIPIVLLSQLNRDVEKRQDKRPVMSDLRDSGAIEQDAATISFVYREGPYGKAPPGPVDDTAEIIVAKCRYGSTGTARCHFHGPSTRFLDLPHLSAPVIAGRSPQKLRVVASDGKPAAQPDPTIPF